MKSSDKRWRTAETEREEPEDLKSRLARLVCRIGNTRQPWIKPKGTIDRACAQEVLTCVDPTWEDGMVLI